jgi:hypothetical protein
LILSPPEKDLLSSIAHLSHLHCNLLVHTSEILSTHASSICRAVATSIKLTHLSRFQQRVIDVENGILRKDTGSVGAYNIVPLTAIVGQFSDWTRRMEWFWDITQCMMKDGCTGAQLIDKLCDSVQTGYSDIEDVALHLVKVAETAWIKQASSWILYGRLPTFGGDDFFVHQGRNENAQVCLSYFKNDSRSSRVYLTEFDPRFGILSACRCILIHYSIIFDGLQFLSCVLTTTRNT